MIAAAQAKSAQWGAEASSLLAGMQAHTYEVPRVPGLGRLRQLYQMHYRDPRRERVFLASIAFVVAVLVVRLVTSAIANGLGPFSDVSVGGTHVHHLVWGILLLLGVGYLTLIQAGGDLRGRTRVGRVLALAYGAAAALTLDEFALWLNLDDVYWDELGKQSIQAMMVFGGLLAVALYGGSLARAVGREFHVIAKETATQAAIDVRQTAVRARTTVTNLRTPRRGPDE
jgi:hypothetical protein